MFWKLFANIAAANLEAQQVIALRIVKLTQGGTGAHKETHKMISEKVLASVEAATSLAGGASPDAILRRYRTIMRANRKRLTRR